MKGKLAYAFLFFVIGTVSLSVRKGIQRGRPAAVDAIASSIAMTGAVLVFLPVASILFITVQKGLAGRDRAGAAEFPETPERAHTL